MTVGDARKPFSSESIVLLAGGGLWTIYDLAKLLGEGLPGDPESPLSSDDEPIDRHIDLATAIRVLH
jgi:hypothetical protein